MFENWRLGKHGVMPTSEWRYDDEVWGWRTMRATIGAVRPKHRVD